jgi:energy-coupling factor transporter ATP-binding protein EcfA2
MDNTYELSRNGLLTTLVIKDHDYDVVEYTITKKLVNVDGKVIVDSTNQMFFSNREFKDFFEPIINDMKVRFDDANNI